MLLTFYQIVFVTTILYLFSSINDGYAGRSSKADWILAHVLNGVHRDSLSVAFYLYYFQGMGEQNFYKIFLLLLYHFAIFQAGYYFGQWLRTFVPPKDKKDFADLVFIYGVKFALGVVLFVILETRIW